MNRVEPEAELREERKARVQLRARQHDLRVLDGGERRHGTAMLPGRGADRESPWDVVSPVVH
jgi:hypothetical protein